MISGLIRKHIFLIDGTGALITAVLLSQVLARHPAFFGVGENFLYLLATIATAFAVYSLANYFSNNQLKIWKRNLRIVAIANVIYCVVTGLMLIYLFEKITLYGWIYFLGEIMIILLLARLELKISQQTH